MANIQFIADELKEYCIESTFAQIPDYCPNSIEFKEGKAPLKQDVIYLAENGKNASTLYFNDQYIKFSCPVAKLFNTISRNTTAVKEYRDAFFNLLQSNARLHDFTNLAAKFCCGAALYITPSGKVSSYSNLDAVPFIRNFIDKKGCISDELIEKLFGRDTKNIRGTITLLGQPTVYGSRFFDNDGALMGTALCITPKEITAIIDTRTICDYFIFFLAKSKGSTLTTKKMESISQVWGQIMEGSLEGNQGIRGAFSEIGVELSDCFRVAVISFKNLRSAIPFNHMNARLTNLFPGSNLTLYHDYIVLFVNDDADGSQSSLSEAKKTDLIKLLRQYDASMMFSNITNNAGALKATFLMIKRTLNIVSNLFHAKEETLYYYEEYFLYNIFDMAINHYQQFDGVDDTLCLIHPAAIKISKYDEENKSQIRHVLYSYLINDRNVLQTAAVLGMHRNTVQTKINIAKEIIGKDFDDPKIRQRIIASIQFMSYFEQVKSRHDEGI